MRRIRGIPEKRNRPKRPNRPDKPNKRDKRSKPSKPENLLMPEISLSFLEVKPDDLVKSQNSMAK
jgi:hypothetical protein